MSELIGLNLVDLDINNATIVCRSSGKERTTSRWKIGLFPI